MPVGNDAFCCASAAAIGIGVRNQKLDLARDGTTNADAAQPIAVVGVNRARLRVCRIKHIVLVYIDAARPPKLIPRVEMVTLLVEDLNAIIAAIANK